VLNAAHGEAQAVLEHQPEDKHGIARPLVRGTFVMGWFARELNEISFIGPLGFYMSAQGSLIIYVAIICLLRLLHEQPGQGIRCP
jgi:hypothetical protein